MLRKQIKVGSALFLMITGSDHDYKEVVNV
jgi:hypothetical protein